MSTYKGLCPHEVYCLAGKTDKSINISYKTGERYETWWGNIGSFENRARGCNTDQDKQSLFEEMMFKLLVEE